MCPHDSPPLLGIYSGSRVEIQSSVIRKERLIYETAHIEGALGLCEEAGPGGQQPTGDAQETLLGCEAIQVASWHILETHRTISMDGDQP